jgi:hypothetical protein
MRKGLREEESGTNKRVLKACPHGGVEETDHQQGEEAVPNKRSKEDSINFELIKSEERNVPKDRVHRQEEAENISARGQKRSAELFCAPDMRIIQIKELRVTNGVLYVHSSYISRKGFAPTPVPAPPPPLPPSINDDPHINHYQRTWWLVGESVCLSPTDCPHSHPSLSLPTYHSSASHNL